MWTGIASKNEIHIIIVILIFIVMNYFIESLNVQMDHGQIIYDNRTLKTSEVTA